MKLTYFQSLDFLAAIKALLNELKVPFNAIADEPVPVREILSDKTYKDNATFRLINEVFFVGMVDDAAFEGNESLAPEKIKSDYDGILFFGVTLDQRENNRLPTRGQLAEIARAFNREFYYTPVVVIFKYQDERRKYIAFANTERLPYKQEWREGEKAGKVSLLRDVAIDAPHRGHEDIINQLRIPTSGTKAVTDFDSLYKYWQEVFSVSILNKKFYQELSNWYFWAIKHVTFPNRPTPELALEKGVKLEELVQEHNATNVIRLLTRLLFTWFIKEKKLIPEELFDLRALQKDILKEISPYHEEGMFKQANEESVYYKAILQNLFFASLNCPIEPDDMDERKRSFRGLESYGKHRGVDYLMRYEKYFKDPQAFLDLMNSTVPFLNGGLFECLDEKIDKNLYIDGFSDQMTKGEQLIVPDYLFFGLDEEVDLSKDYGLKSKKYKKAAVKGLINILKSYKFTVTENTPIEEDVALDPELLGKVFENLLASYNPETKTTARKQTGSFYTPREIVNYMVDESLIGYLKNQILKEESIFLELGKTQVESFRQQWKIRSACDRKQSYGK
jgi:adenine-specific DNA-methyltransferase